ncbi:hypothetical protein SAMN05444955_10819 [Lihuaxuella thermophila]|uniref:Uncharacterized protein n=1 Tax=Lihuaxuella thermophila TaxID=1173111 RepID=A0A1H8F5C4_9BACL|nr:hypothetical protein SAMN05444955_10819 [Lihuaxuella thermophila]
MSDFLLLSQVLIDAGSFFPVLFKKAEGLIYFPVRVLL